MTRGSGTERATMRLVLMLVAGLAATAAGAFFGLAFLWPAPVVDKKPALEQTPPLQPITRVSTVVAPAAIALSAVRSALESAAPRNLSGNRTNPAKDNLTNISMDWVINRGAFAVTGRPDVLTVSTPLTGSLHASGVLGAVGNASTQLGGAIGNVLGAIGGKPGRQLGELAAKPFDQRGELHGSVVLTAQPAILPSWRIAPNLAAQVAINDVTVTVSGLKMNLANEVKPLVDKAVREQVSQLESRIRNDPSLEQSVRSEWSELCRSFPLGVAGSGSPNLWLEIKPTRVAAARPKVSSDALNLLIGLAAETRVVSSETRPSCPFPSQIEIVPQLTPGAVNVGVPIDVPFTDVNKLLEAQLAGKTFPEDHSGSIAVTIKHVEVAASGSRLLISLAVRAGQRRLISFGADAVIHVWGRPELDRDKQSIRLTDIDVDVDSSAALGLVDAAATAALPYLKPMLADKAVIDLKPFTSDARAKIENVLSQFQKTRKGVRIDTRINDLRLVGIAFDAKTLRVIAEADGNVNVAVPSLALPK
jgi:hypothetical protein